jgi:hypothetical protein
MIKRKALTASKSGLSVEEYRIGAIDALQRKIRLNRRYKKTGKCKKSFQTT